VGEKRGSELYESLYIITGEETSLWTVAYYYVSSALKYFVPCIHAVA
jgi:hypothetical protein